MASKVELKIVDEASCEVSVEIDGSGVELADERGNIIRLTNEEFELVVAAWAEVPAEEQAEEE